MAWSWSHTNEAQANARCNLHASTSLALRIIFAEWRAAQLRKPEHGSRWSGTKFDQKKYDKALQHAATLPDDVLADQIWEWACELATCDNGGSNCWVCPYGCHTVAWDPPEEPEEAPFDLLPDWDDED